MILKNHIYLKDVSFGSVNAPMGGSAIIIENRTVVTITIEEENSIEYMILRKNYMTLLFQKLIYIFLFIIVYKTMIYLVSWLFFHSFITLSYWACIDTMIPYFILTLLIALFYFIHIKK